ncbi:MAG: hypothetical protein FJZ95_11010 [Chloroflexi bacterium]|nr:hypothetical protein [Chloroflexota bacterium]
MAWESRSWNAVNEGEALPVQTRQMTRVAIIAMAFAARDFLPPVHVDPEIARSMGLKDVNLNIISTGGLIEKYLTGWSGPKGKLRRMKYAIGAGVFPGDTLTHTGKVAKKYVADGEHLVDIEYTLSVASGPHAMGTATMALPA